MWFHYCRVGLIPHWLIKDKSLYLSHTCLIIFFRSLTYIDEYAMLQQLSARSMFFLFFVCVHIHKCMSMLACAARCCRQGHRLVNKYYRSTCFDEGATDWGVNSVPRPFFKDQFTGRGGWDIIPLFSLKKYVNSPQTNWHLQEKERKCALVFVGIKRVGGN